MARRRQKGSPSCARICAARDFLDWRTIRTHPQRLHAARRLGASGRVQRRGIDCSCAPNVHNAFGCAR